MQNNKFIRLVCAYLNKHTIPTFRGASLIKIYHIEPEPTAGTIYYYTTSGDLNKEKMEGEQQVSE